MKTGLHSYQLPVKGGSIGDNPITSSGLGEEGAAIAARLLQNPKVNSPKNDEYVYGRALPGHPAPLFGQQYRVSAREARKLVAAVLALNPYERAPVVKELIRRNHDHAAKGTMEIISKQAAAALNDLAVNVGVAPTFTSGNLPYVHPVG